MSFGTSYFEKIGELLTDYFKTYPCGLVTVTIVAYEKEYSLVRILKCDEDLLTFAYYCDEKAHKLLPAIQEKSGERTAWPAVTVPYEAILSVEFIPGKVDSTKEIGFKPSGSGGGNGDG